MFNGAAPVDTYEFTPSVFQAEGYNEIRLDVTDSLRDWLSGDPKRANQGWFLTADQAQNWCNGDGLEIYGATETVTARRPKLEITYLSAGGDNIPPDPATNLNAIPGDRQVSLSWTNPGADCSGVVVLRKSGVIPVDPADGTVVYDGLASICLDNQGLINGKSYYYAVFAYDYLRNYSQKTWIKATPALTGTPPNDPSGLTVNLSGTALSFTWADNSGNEDWFVIEQQEAGGLWVFVAYPGAGETSLIAQRNDPNFQLKPNTVYQYRIKAVNSLGNSGYANCSSGITTPGFPAAPTGLAWIIISAGRVNLSWTDNAGNETGYRIDVCSNDTRHTVIRSIDLPVDARAVSVTGLIPGVEYLFKVAAVNGWGENTVWTDVIVTTADPKGGIL